MTVNAMIQTSHCTYNYDANRQHSLTHELAAYTVIIGYNIVWSGLCECNEHHPLQTCCNLIISW